MSLETDLLIDRRRLKRRLFAWRVVAVIAVAAAILVGIGKAGLLPERRHIERVTVSGIITEDRRLTESIEALAKDDRVPAVVVVIDSPGGSVAGGESLHDALARVAKVKPVVAVMEGTAASGGYMTAVACTRIYARESTLTGSIGVLMETGEVSGLLGKLGISTDAIVSGPMKDQPSYTHPTSPAARQMLQGLVMDMYDQFVTMVATGRHMEPDKVRPLADGRPYTGRQALALGLVDAIGGEQDARDWLAQTHQISADLPVEDLHPASWSQRAFRSLLGGIVKTVVEQRVTLDGAWALWQCPISGI
jgi:protease IV